MTTPSMTISASSSPSSTDSPQESASPGILSETWNEDTVKRLTQWANEQFIEMKSARSHTERQWYINLAFYYGKQNVVYRQNPNLVYGSNGALYVPPAPYWRVRAVFNYTKPVVRREMAKLNSSRPSVNVLPASTEDRDIFAAQAGEEIWESTYRRKVLADTFRRATFWSQTCGTGFVKTNWNPELSDDVSGVVGDFEFCPETPFHVFVPNLREEDLEQQPFLIHAQMKDLDYVKILLNDPSFNSADALKSEQILDDTWVNLVGANLKRDQKQVLVLECWIKPGRLEMMPEGGQFTVVGSRIMPGGTRGWPYSHGMYPFAKISHIPSGKFYADSTINDLIPIQKEFNRTRSQIIEAKNRMAKPQLLAEQGSIDPSKITTEPGQVILYKTGFNPPTPIPLSNLPSYVPQELDRLVNDFNEISGQHEVSRGQAPSGVTAATAISYLQEQDDTMLSFTFASFEEAIEKTAKMTLALANQYWTEERIVKIVGPSGSFDAKAFKGSDLRDNSDVRVEAGSALPSSKAATQAFLMDLMNAGHIDPQKGLELMQIGSLNKLYETVHLDIRQAQRENLKLAVITPEDEQMNQQQAQMDFQQNPDDYFEPSDPMSPNRVPVAAKPLVPVNSWDNHAVHIQVHNDYRKSQAFDQADDVTKQLFEDHVNAHMAQMMGMMGAGFPVSEPEKPGPKPMPENQMG